MCVIIFWGLIAAVILLAHLDGVNIGPALGFLGVIALGNLIVACDRTHKHSDTENKS